MTSIYIDSDFKCHTENGAGRTAVETDFFDGRCAEFIEGYRFVPSGSTWTREDGEEFAGEMVSPWKPFAEIDAAQRQYDIEQYEAAIDELLLLV
jgi:hypothetical protein